MIRLPFSFRTLLVAALVLLALLPSLALIQMWWHLDKLERDAELRLANADRWQLALRSLSEQEEHLERSTRQWLLLRDPALLQLASTYGKEMQTPLTTLQSVPDVTLQQLVQDELKKVEQINRWLQGDPSLSSTQILALFDQLSLLHGQMNHRVRLQAVLERKQWADALRLQHGEADRMALFSVVLALVLAILLSTLLVAPLGRLRGKIGRLAQGVRGQSWQIEGPNDLRELALALQTLDARLEQLETEKASFFRQVSHELKTPLAAINEAAALLADEVPGALTAAQREIVAIQQSNVATLRSRVETLLKHDVARWLSQPLEFQPFSLQQLLAQREHDWQALISRRSLSLVYQLSVDWIEGDKHKVQTILDNLLINAIRYSPAQSQLTVSSRREGAVVVIRVCDQGPGVSEAEAKRIFDPFYSGVPPEGESPGSGIGLTMARTFAQLMGGDVRLLPSAAKGACFELCWAEKGEHDAIG